VSACPIFCSNHNEKATTTSTTTRRPPPPQPQREDHPTSTTRRRHPRPKPLHSRVGISLCRLSSIGISGPACPNRPKIPEPLLPPPSLLLRPGLGSRSGPGRLGPGLGLSARAVATLPAPAHIGMPSAQSIAPIRPRAAHAHQGSQTTGKSQRVSKRPYTS
jgi:hypothetical protein